MRRQCQLLTVLLAWFIATGGQWDVVQAFGWVRMVAKYAQTMPLAKAVAKTFDGELCGVCELVSHAKHQVTAAAVPAADAKAKFLFVFPSSSRAVATVLESVTWSPSDLHPVSSPRPAPPTPPPRLA